MRNQTVVVGQNVTFKANVVGGAEGCTYTWYENNSESTTGGVRIENPEGNSSTYTVKATEELSGKYYYCVITKDNQTVVTNAAKLTVTKYKFDLIIDEMNSKEVIVKENTDVTAKLVYTGTEAIENADKYKIYLGYGGVESTIDLNKNKIMIPGSYIEMIQQRNIKIRGEVLDSENNIIGTTEVSELIVLGDIENQTVIENKEVTFEVQITGEAGKYGYQWYRSDSNSTEAGTKIENATDKSYKVKATEELDGKYYYCEVTNNNQTITTNAAKLTITQDIEGPIIKGAVLSQEEWSKENKTITITAEDESGVVEYGVSNSNEVNPTTWSTSNIIEISENAIYYVWAKDSKGNISCLNTPIESKIDKVAPKIEKIEVQNLEIVVTGIIDEESGVEKISISKESGKYEWVDIISNNYRTGQLAVGKYYIAVKDKAGNIVEKSIEIKETKVLVSDIEVEQEVIELNSKQKSKKLNVTIKPENATNKQLKWTSSNENIVKVDKDGIITAVADGKAKITIETMDGSKISKIVNVIVKEHTNPTKIELEGKSRIRKGEKSKYTVKYTPEGANINTEVIWSISNEEIATINEKGEVVGQKAGKVKVIGTLKNISNIVAEKEIEVYYENPTTAEPNVEVTTNSIKVENRQKNEYAKIVEIKYGISEDGENWKWQEGQTFDGLKENKEYKVRTKVKDENGVEIESEYVEVKTKELVIGKIVLKKNKTEDYEESSWVNGNISYEIIDENNMTTVKVLNEEGKEVEIKENTISENGIYTIVVETTDGVNRKTKEYKVKIDKGTAEIEIEKINGAQQKSVKLKIYMKKSISGIKTVKINGKEIEHNNEECIYEVNKNGSYKIEIEDNAGNVIEKVVEISNIIKNEENNGNKDEEKTERTDNSKENNDKSSIKVLPKTGEKKAILGIIVSVMILLYAFYKYNKNKIK